MQPPSPVTAATVTAIIYYRRRRIPVDPGRRTCTIRLAILRLGGVHLCFMEISSQTRQKTLTLIRPFWVQWRRTLLPTELGPQTTTNRFPMVKLVQMHMWFMKIRGQMMSILEFFVPKTLKRVCRRRLQFRPPWPELMGVVDMGELGLIQGTQIWARFLQGMAQKKICLVMARFLVRKTLI